MSTTPLRHLPLPETSNIRDLGGYPRRGGGTTQWRRILRGDSLSSLTADSLGQLAELDLAMVIDLRGPAELLDAPNPFGTHPRVAYRNIALFDALSPIAMGQVPFDMAARYRGALDHCGPRIAEALRAIAEAPPGLVLFHCTAGKDRTGILAALLLLLADVGEGEVALDYAMTASVAGPMLDRLRQAAQLRGADRDHIDRTLASDASTMFAMMAHLRSVYAGVDPYCRDIALTPNETEAIVRRLCE